MALAEAKGYGSLRAAAIAAEVDYSLVNKWATGAKAPTLASVENFVAALGADMVDLYSLAIR